MTSILKLKSTTQDAEYSNESLEELKAEIPKHINTLNTIKSNMEEYVKKHNKDENSKPQCEFFNSIVPLITNTEGFLKELNKIIKERQEENQKK